MIQRRQLSWLAASLTLIPLIVFATPAVASSVVAKQQRGAQILSQVRRGALAPKQLTNSQYEELGEYLMGRALGSTQLHQRLNTLMNEMMGPTAADQMHVYLAERYLGIRAAPTRADAALYGLVGTMMSSDRGSSLAGMMSAYLDGRGTAGYQMMGYHGSDTAASSGSTGWPTAAIVATTALAVLLIGTVVALAIPRLHRRPQGTSPTTP